MKKMSYTVRVLGKCGHWFAHDPAILIPTLCPDCAEETADGAKNKQKKSVAVERKTVYNKRRK